MTPGTEHLPEIAADFAAGRLTYFTAPNFDTVWDPVTGTWVDAVDTRYGITSAFVRTYWHFAPDSILFLNACWSGYTSDAEGAQSFISACWDAGVGLYLGWSKLANSNTCFKTVRYFTDRLIGANKYMKENPNQRGFPWELVIGDMTTKGLTYEPVTGAYLIPFPATGGNSILLDPSIQELLVNEWDEKLILRGYFGSTAGKVIVRSRELGGCTWKHDEIVCPLPRTGSGSNGDVFVEVEGGLGRPRNSNVHQLTEWNIPLKYTWEPYAGVEGLKMEGTGKLRFRADVGSYRLKPGGTPQAPLRGMIPTHDSFLPVTASGSHSDGSCTTTLSGSRTFMSQTANLGASLLIVSAAKLDTLSGHIGSIGLAFGTQAGGFPFLFTFSGPGCSGTAQAPAPFGLLGGPFEFPPPAGVGATVPLTGFSLNWDPQFRIPATRFIDVGMGGTITVEWPAVDPVPPVRADLAR